MAVAIVPMAAEFGWAPSIQVWRITVTGLMLFASLPLRQDVAEHVCGNGS